MIYHETTNCIYDYGLIEDIVVPDTVPVSGFSWPTGTFNPRPSTIRRFVEEREDGGCVREPFLDPDPLFADLDGSIVDSDESRSTKRGRSESCSGTSSKACREKLRRDKLNDKFVELASHFDPGRPPKTDKAAILVDAVRLVAQLRKEAQKLKDPTSDLQKKIKEAEKNELRDEKQRLKMEKEKLEQQVNSMNLQATSMAPPPAGYAQGQVGNKLVPAISYPGMRMAMWQFMPPAAVDTSQDHVLHPPVA